jgi:hypothetical protein
LILDLTYVFYSSLIIVCLLPLYIYREKFFSKNYKNNGGFPLFVSDLKEYMSNFHPKIKIDYSFINRTVNEPNLELRETIIIENVISQFFNYAYAKKTQDDIPREKHWLNYEEKSISNPKYPSDWPLRKEFAWKRDNKCCNRCGNNLNLKDSYTCFVKDIKDGGGYNLENIITLCIDCNKILHSQNPKSTMSSLVLNEKLMALINA